VSGCLLGGLGEDRVFPRRVAGLTLSGEDGEGKSRTDLQTHREPAQTAERSSLLVRPGSSVSAANTGAPVVCVIAQKIDRFAQLRDTVRQRLARFEHTACDDSARASKELRRPLESRGALLGAARFPRGGRGAARLRCARSTSATELARPHRSVRTRPAGFTSCRRCPIAGLPLMSAVAAMARPAAASQRSSTSQAPLLGKLTRGKLWRRRRRTGVALEHCVDVLPAPAGSTSAMGSATTALAGSRSVLHAFNERCIAPILPKGAARGTAQILMGSGPVRRPAGIAARRPQSPAHTAPRPWPCRRWNSNSPGRLRKVR